ncbi:hypothetical protein JZ751_012363 [Albula glossodonta]|uniref:Uncharacterized protein n=1 Tax=Albula glossodonta TaxID=121402 RepID=A0A8T2PSF2_9TELE|nr:hypothetical protein JZ751_012363 [Albula glossodonta]
MTGSIMKPACRRSAWIQHSNKDNDLIDGPTSMAFPPRLLGNYILKIKVQHPSLLYPIQE